MMGMIMGAWFMVTAVAMMLGGWVAGLTNIPASEPSKFVSLAIYGHVFLWIGLVTFVVTLIMWTMVPWLKRMMVN
jgi:POT family proton-dependent oligopeptide transporter